MEALRPRREGVGVAEFSIVSLTLVPCYLWSLGLNNLYSASTFQIHRPFTKTAPKLGNAESKILQGLWEISY